MEPPPTEMEPPPPTGMEPPPDDQSTTTTVESEADDDTTTTTTTTRYLTRRTVASCLKGPQVPICWPATYKGDHYKVLCLCMVFADESRMPEKDYGMVFRDYWRLARMEFHGWKVHTCDLGHKEEDASTCAACAAAVHPFIQAVTHPHPTPYHPTPPHRSGRPASPSRL